MVVTITGAAAGKSLKGYPQIRVLFSDGSVLPLTYSPERFNARVLFVQILRNIGISEQTLRALDGGGERGLKLLASAMIGLEADITLNEAGEVMRVNKVRDKDGRLDLT